LEASCGKKKKCIKDRKGPLIDIIANILKKKNPQNKKNAALGYHCVLVNVCLRRTSKLWW